MMAILGGVEAADAADPVLIKRHEATLMNEIVPAYQRGDSLAVLEAASALVGKLDEARMKLANDVLRKEDVPELDKLLADARRLLVEQGDWKRLPKPTIQELAIVVPRLQADTAAVLADAARFATMKDPLPRFDLPSEYQALFWESHVLDNRLTNAGTLALYTDSLVRQLRNRQHLAKLPDLQREAIEADHRAFAAEVATVQQELRERNLEMRLNRLRAAVRVLKLHPLEEERFVAAYSVAVDSRMLKEFLSMQAKPNRAALDREFLTEEVADLEARGRELGGDLIAKSEMLFRGLHWWLRGRYGAGAEAAGLFKGEIALSSPEAMFRLIMPSAPTEIAQLMNQGGKVYPVDRRHYYTWAFEDRKVLYHNEAGEFT
jgi:hypothetical protein